MGWVRISKRTIEASAHRMGVVGRGLDPRVQMFERQRGGITQANERRNEADYSHASYR